MGKRDLPPAPSKGQLFESLVEHGLVTDDIVHQWSQKLRDQKSKEDLMKRAHRGDGNAMALVGDCYYRGSMGFKKNDRMAFNWLQRADAAGNARATAQMGYMLATGRGVPENEQEGMMYIGIAAGRGDESAAKMLGTAYAQGLHGLPINREKALYWLNLAVQDECPLKSMTEKGKLDAQEQLDGIFGRKHI
jgi:TPR repeat protein